jgi:hypothetical protein
MLSRSRSPTWPGGGRVSQISCTDPLLIDSIEDIRFTVVLWACARMMVLLPGAGWSSTGTALPPPTPSFIVHRSSFVVLPPLRLPRRLRLLYIENIWLRLAFCFLFVSLYLLVSTRCSCTATSVARTRHTFLSLSLSLALLPSFVVFFDGGAWALLVDLRSSGSSRATCTYLNFFAQVLPYISFVPAVRSFSSSLF